ncbi:HPr family phosphocarrier protein [Blautia sp. Sow4_E7]|jgi:phosphocarrier protein HPr|uniref:HPr family phosphocarrier protein n=1 Tax=Blautia sp. Sow4_E7 TaxID=3438749 RepID=UPI003F915EC5
MVKRKVRIENMKDVDTFNKLCSKFDCDMDLISGKYYVNAKSIMGIFSLDLEMPLELVADMEDEKIVDNVFKEFLV